MRDAVDGVASPVAEPPAHRPTPERDLPRAEQVLEALDDEQRAAVVAPVGPVRILAGAGTGKTRALTHRIAYQHHLGAAPVHHVLAVTHTRKAAGEMRDRLGGLGVPNVQVMTYHAAAAAQLREFWGRSGLPGGRLELLGHRERGAERRTAVRRALQREPTPEQVRDLGTEISWAAARGLDCDTYEAGAGSRGGTLSPQQVAEAWRLYGRAKRRKEVLDFDDLLRELTALLERDEAVAAALRARYLHLYVDEYQDTDPAQERLLRGWLGESRSLCVVGDPNQSIYGFKGAEPGLIEQFTARYSGALSIALVKDYRSTPQVVALANRIVGASAATALVGQRAAGPEPELVAFEDEDAETQALVHAVQGLLTAGTPATEIAVLHRYNAQGAAFRLALLAANVAVTRLREDEAFFQEPVVVQVLRGLQDLDRGGHGLEGLASVLRQAGYDPQARPTEDGRELERYELCAALLQIAEGLEEDRRSTVQALQAEFARLAQEEREPGGRGVAVGTIHAAKGLEWDAVLLPRMTDGSLPASYARSPEQQAEERRLFYVAVTRAREVLRLSWASRSDVRSQRPSPFLDLMRPPATPKPAQRPSIPWTMPAPSPGGRPAGGGGKGRPPRAPSPVPWPVGQRVLHDQYGMGVVVEHQPGAAVVDFGGTYGRKRVAATTRKMARLP
jgi:DNA helicase-2/ATP-dependent DNA helicase PcrA